jgi:DNA-binding transcriptional ArsR family regulator
MAAAAETGFEPAPTRDLVTPEELRAIGDETRSDILSLLNEGEATVSQLAAALDRPRGSIGYHVRVLADHDLVRVVRTRPVRGFVEKYYARTARTFIIHGPPDDDDPFPFLSQAMRECRFVDGETLPRFTLRHIRIPAAAAEAFMTRLLRLAEEFAASPAGGDRVYGLLAGVFPTDRPSLARARRHGERA